MDETLLGIGFPPDLTFCAVEVYQYTYSGETAARYIDSVKVSDGALFTANFTPPTGPLTPP